MNIGCEPHSSFLKTVAYFFIFYYVSEFLVVAEYNLAFSQFKWFVMIPSLCVIIASALLCVKSGLRFSQSLITSGSYSLLKEVN